MRIRTTNLSITGTDCIEITKHREIAEVGKQQMKEADRDIVKQIKPLLNFGDLDKSDVCN